LKVLTLSDLKESFANKRVAIIGSAPSVLQNQGDIIDKYDEIIRINNFKVKGVDLKGNNYDYRHLVGSRTDWHYSFYGGSIRTSKAELEGIKGHLCKCPNEEIVHLTDWHIKRKAEKGCGWAWIYRARTDYWQAPVYIPTKEHYLRCFYMLGNRVPTTGFACIWEMISLPVKEMYITGFDFFKSGVHNVTEIWKPGKADDPIGHVPQREFEFLKKWVKEMPKITLDKHLRRLIKCRS
jgi:hypothetical protein